MSIWGFTMRWSLSRFMTGLILLGVAAFFSMFFGLDEVLGPDGLDRAFGVVLVLFIGPLLASGLMLLIRREAAED